MIVTELIFTYWASVGAAFDLTVAPVTTSAASTVSTTVNDVAEEMCPRYRSWCRSALRLPLTKLC